MLPSATVDSDDWASIGNIVLIETLSISYYLFKKTNINHVPVTLRIKAIVIASRCTKTASGLI